MQTFLPFPDFLESARCLDNKRLGKQRVEAKQIYLAITNPSYGWQNHPAVNMWRNYPFGLAYYAEIVCKEWIGRGYSDTLLPFFQNEMRATPIQNVIVPPWFGNEAFHRSHRSQLWNKDPQHYSQFYEDGKLRLEYVWPR